MIKVFVGIAVAILFIDAGNDMVNSLNYPHVWISSKSSIDASILFELILGSFGLCCLGSKKKEDDEDKF